MQMGGNVSIRESQTREMVIIYQERHVTNLCLTDSRCRPDIFWLGMLRPLAIVRHLFAYH